MPVTLFTLFCVIIAFSLQALASTKDHSDRFALAIISEYPGYHLDITPVNEDLADQVRYKPNINATAGFQVSAFGFSLAYLKDVIPEEDNSLDYGQTSYEDIRLGYFFGKKSRYQAHIYYNRYKGMYVENSVEVDPSYSATTAKIKNSNLQSFNTGFSLFWVNDPDDYSPAAAFDQSAQQTKSGGSWVLKASIDSSLITDEEEFIPSTIRANYGVDQNITLGRFVSMGLMGGYGYAFVWSDLFLALQAMIGGGRQSSSYYTSDNGKADLVETLAKTSLGYSFGYNSKNFYLVFYYLEDNTEFKTESVELTNNQSLNRISLGFRF